MHTPRNQELRRIRQLLTGILICLALITLALIPELIQLALGVAFLGFLTLIVITAWVCISRETVTRWQDLGHFFSRFRKPHE